MTFIAMILALVTAQVWAPSNPLHQDTWFRNLQSSVRGFGFSPTLGVLIYIAIPLIVVSLLLNAIEGLIFGLIWIGGAALVLLYSLGRGDYKTLVEDYRRLCISDDFEAASSYAQSSLEIGEEDCQSSPALHSAVQAQLLYRGYQRWFSVVFYFVLLGPIAALAYRLLQLSMEGPECDLLDRVLHYADWIPVRLLSGGFAIAGDFLGSRDEFLSHVFTDEADAGDLLLAVGRAAASSTGSDLESSEASFSEVSVDEINELQGLMSRSAGTWLAAISILVLFS